MMLCLVLDEPSLKSNRLDSNNYRKKKNAQRKITYLINVTFLILSHVPYLLVQHWIPPSSPVGGSNVSKACSIKMLFPKPAAEHGGGWVVLWACWIALRMVDEVCSCGCCSAGGLSSRGSSLTAPHRELWLGCSATLEMRIRKTSASSPVRPSLTNIISLSLSLLSFVLQAAVRRVKRWGACPRWWVFSSSWTNQSRLSLRG